MNMLEILTNCVWFNGKDQVSVVGFAADYLDRFSFRIATNSLSKLIDLYVSYNHYFFRWSGKRNKWEDMSEAKFNQGSPIGFTVTKKEKSMSNEMCVKKENNVLNKVFGRFGKADKGAFALSMEGGVAVKRSNGGYVCLRVTPNETQLVDVDKFAIDADVFYYLPSDLASLKANDVVLAGNHLGFVVGVDNNEVRVYNVETESITVVKPSVHFLLPKPFVTKVVSLFSTGGNNNNPLFWWFMMDKSDKSNKLPLMLMMSGMLNGGAGQPMNPLLLMMLMGDKTDDKMLPFLLLSQGGNLGNMNPMMLYAMMSEGGSDMWPLFLMGGDMFGNKPAPAPAPVA